MIRSEKEALANREYADATFNFMTQVCCKFDGNLCWSLVTLKQFSAAWGFSLCCFCLGGTLLGIVLALRGLFRRYLKGRWSLA